MLRKIPNFDKNENSKIAKELKNAKHRRGVDQLRVFFQKIQNFENSNFFHFFVYFFELIFHDAAIAL